MAGVVKLTRRSLLTLPPDLIRVDRATRFGNPFSSASNFEDWLDGSRVFLELLVPRCAHYTRRYLGERREWVLDHICNLTGHSLGCWCHYWDGRPPNPKTCHADILFERANGLILPMIRSMAVQGRFDGFSH